ncbi:MAG: MFS transporter [Nocardioidaceae bacterium]|nr:MFS transporter [Nocardioidaceae bacterium]
MRLLRDVRHLLRGQRFRQLFIVRVTSQAGDGVFQVALASYVLFSPERQPDAAAIAAGLAAILLPFSVLGPFAGVFLDRWSRRQILVLSNAIRVAPVLAAAVLIAVDRSGPTLFALILVAFSVNRFFLAGLSAALPHVVGRHELVLANSITPTSGTVAFIGGLGVATAARGLIPLDDADGVIAVVAALTYAAAALLALRLPRDLLGPDFDPDRPDVRRALGSVVHGLVAGLAHLRQRPSAAHALGVISAHRFFYGLSTVATILLYRNYFNDPNDADAGLAGLSIAVLVSGLGFLAAAVLTPIAAQRMAATTWMLVLLLAAAAFEVFPGGLYTEPSLLVAAFVLGVSSQGVKICVDTLVQTGVDDAFRGRVFALYDVAFNVVFVAAAALGAVTIPATGKSYGVLALISGGYAATAVAYAFALRLTRRTGG